MSLLQYQPIKGFYVLFELLVTAFLRLPLWILIASSRKSRARPSWTVKREVMVRVIKRASKIIFR